MATAAASWSNPPISSPTFDPSVHLRVMVEMRRRASPEGWGGKGGVWWWWGWGWGGGGVVRGEGGVVGGEGGVVGAVVGKVRVSGRGGGVVGVVWWGRRGERAGVGQCPAQLISRHMALHDAKHSPIYHEQSTTHQQVHGLELEEELLVGVGGRDHLVLVLVLPSDLEEDWGSERGWGVVVRGGVLL